VVAIAGAPKKQWLGREVTPEIERAMNNRRSFVLPSARDRRDDTEEEGWNLAAMAVAPIIAEGDPIGAVILATEEPGVEMGQLELKLVETAAGFLARQMEQ